MAGQEQTRPAQQDAPEPDADAAPPLPSASASRVNDDEVDALLDDIDEALEQNAETFVRQFQQKGGQ